MEDFDRCRLDFTGDDDPIVDFLLSQESILSFGNFHGLRPFCVIVCHVVDPRWKYSTTPCRLDAIIFSSVVAHDSTSRCN
jgi:hypothetical protein